MPNLPIMRRILLLATVITACNKAEQAHVDTVGTISSAPVVVQAVSFLGDSLRAIPLSDSTRMAMERDLAAAKTSLDKTPSDPDSIIWYGRRLGYLGRFRESIAA